MNLDDSKVRTRLVISEMLHFYKNFIQKCVLIVFCLKKIPEFLQTTCFLSEVLLIHR